MSLPTVFISYNPNSEIEQTLALRLHTIGAVHGFNMILPERNMNLNTVTNETKGRILLSDYFILFSTGALSNLVQQEINIAFAKHKDKSRILVLYDKAKGKNLKGAENCTEIYIDTREDALKIVIDIASKIKSKAENHLLSTLSGILLIGVGLFALAEILEPVSKPGKKTPSKRKKKVNA